MGGTGTGTGGFDIDGKTYTYDVGDPNAPGAEPPNTDSGDLTVDDSKKDISKRTKETLGKYLGNLTRTNTFSVDSQTSEAKITTEKGVPTTPAETTNSDHFVERSDIKMPFDASEQLKSGNRLFNKVSDPATKLAISKGKTYPQLDDGNVVLPVVKGGDPSVPGTLPQSIAPYVSTVLTNNRFTAMSQAVTVDPKNPGANYNPAFVHPKYGDVSANRLAQVGSTLSIRSSQELGAADRENNPNDGGQEAKSLLPGFNQLGADRINTTILEARDVLDSLTESEVPEGNFVSIAPGGSWGSMNNVQDPYSGITAVGMIALSAALTAAVVVLFEGLGFLLSMIKGGDATGASKNNDGRYVLGRYHLNPGPNPNEFPPSSFPPDIGASLGIRPTVHPFGEALSAGVTTFFGINTNNGIVGQITSGLESSTENPGYNSIVARSIIRSTLTIIDSLKHAFKSPNLVAGVKNVLSVVGVLRSSKLISAMNVFASLGDQFLVIDKLDERVEGLPGEPQRSSRIDKLEDSAPAVQKNRLKNSLKLAWSSNRTPSSYLIPEPVLSLASTGKLGAPNIINSQSPLAKNYYRVMSLSDQVKTALRLPYDSADSSEVTVKSIEGKLEAEYMPFYLHDLRTNEIISFHAFITQLSDDFTPNWEQTEGYGRVDPVKVYKSTTRRINVGFFVVSTSDEDFSDMWIKINKLVTMVYPQYTQGRALTDAENNNQFTQPFSQLVGASPLVRLRLGELFSSNYSRFALARLFGADSNTMKLDGQDVRFSGAANVVKLLADDLKVPDGKTYTLQTNNLARPSESSPTAISLAPPPISSGVLNSDEVAPKFSIPAGDIHYFLFRVRSQSTRATLEIGHNNNVVVVPELMNAKLLQDFFGFSPEEVAAKLAFLKNEYDNQDKPMKRVVGGKYVASINDLRISPDRFQTIVNSSLQESNDNADLISMSLLTDFLSSDKNALVKSFKETQGKGLAGTIDSINFDFFNNVTWETAPGRRAPQFCRVTLGFSPIHDISPGLDHMGFNRAPVYPVASLAHGADREKAGK